VSDPSPSTISVALSPVYQYKGVDPEKAVHDYWNRIKDHEKHYEPVVETNWPFIRIINVRIYILPSDWRFAYSLCYRSGKRLWLMYVNIFSLLSPVDLRGLQ